MARNLRGGYFTFVHDRAEDWQFLQAWQPSWVRLMLQGVDLNRINRVHRTVPDANILLRFWHIDDADLTAHRRMAEDPIAEADRQAEWWAGAFDQIKDVPRSQVYAGAINEPNPHSHGPQIRDYTGRWLERLTSYGIPGVGLFFSAGQPPLPGESPYSWDYFRPLEPVFREGNHIIGLHEYMQPEGMRAVWTDAQGRERKDFGYLINRHTHCPMDLPIGIFEWGIDGLLYNRHAHPEYGNNGWRNFFELWSPTRYADELLACVKEADPRVVTICPFITDAPDRKWGSFETQSAHTAMLARKELFIRPDTPSWPDQPDPPIVTPPPTQPPNDLFERSIAFVLSWEGDTSTDIHDSGNYVNGKFVGTKFGISAQAHPDIDVLNLTLAQAKEIYRSSYWIPSKANTMPWPLCLAVFDLAVNGGVGRAQQALQAVGPDFTKIMAWRIAWYARLTQFDRYGRAWIRRCSALMLVDRLPEHAPGPARQEPWTASADGLIRISDRPVLG